MHLQFWGAARTVTGSMHLVAVNGHRLLLDCGLYQGSRQAAYERNRQLPFDAREIHAVVLSHAHNDHAGNLPSLVRSGFRGHIWSTSATRDLCAYTLRDAAHIQESDVRYVNRRRARQGKTLFTPLYTQPDALETLRRFVAVDYDRDFEPAPGVTARFRDAGHILGSAVVVLDLAEGGRRVRLLFSGDLGRGGLAIVRDPQVAEEVDVLIVESTYGNRVHESRDDSKELLRRIVQQTCADQKGKVIIPSFAMGRTQELVYRLNQLWEGGHLPPVDVYVDSPLAVNLTEVFRVHPECYDEEMRRTMMEDHDHDPLGFDRLRYVRSAEQSKRLNTLRRPAVIISASGMCESGRILHHLANHIGSHKNTVLFVGYQAENTLGRRILEGVSPIRVYGEEYPVRATIRSVEGYSAHADRNELLAWIDRVRQAGPLRRVFVVHGEEAGRNALADTLRDGGIAQVAIPARGERVEL